MSIILLNIGLLKSFHTTVPKHVFQLGGLYFGLYVPFKDPWYNLVQQWLKYLIATSSFVNSVTERVIIKHSLKLRYFLEYKSIPTMNTQLHAVMMMGITMMIVMRTLTSKLKPKFLTAHQLTWKREGAVF